MRVNEISRDFFLAARFLQNMEKIQTISLACYPAVAPLGGRGNSFSPFGRRPERSHTDAMTPLLRDWH